MGHVFADIELSNPRNPDLRPVQVKALADTEALMLCIPEHVALQLDLQPESEREVTVADGRKRKVPYVGPIRVAFDGRSCFVGALVVGDEVFLGAVPMEDMDVVVSPCRRTVTVNPESPNVPHARVKGGPQSAPASTDRQPHRASNPLRQCASLGTPGTPPAARRPKC